MYSIILIIITIIASSKLSSIRAKDRRPARPGPDQQSFGPVRSGPIPLEARAGPGRSKLLELRAGPVRAVAPGNSGRSGPKPGHGPWINSTQREVVVVVTREDK